MPDKDNTNTNNNSNKRKIQTSNQSSKHRKKQEGTAIAIPSRDAPQRERPFTDPRRAFPTTNANKTIRRRSDFDSDFMENRISKMLNKAAASSRKNRSCESEPISLVLPSSSSSDIKPSKFASTKQPAITRRTVDPAKLLEIIRSQKQASQSSRSNVIHKHKVFPLADFQTNRDLFKPLKDGDDEDEKEDEDNAVDKDKSPGSSSSYSSSNKAKSTEVIEIDSDEETNPSSVATTEKKSAPFDFLNVGVSNAKPTIVADLPKVALTAPKPKSYVKYINRSNDQAKNKGLSTSISMSSSKPNITASLSGDSKLPGNASSTKNDRLKRDAASSLQSIRQSNSDITSRKYAEVTTPFTTQLRSKKLGSTTSTTPLSSMPPVNISESYKPMSTSSVSSSSRSSFIPPLSYRKKSDTSTSSSSTYKPDHPFASSPLNRIGNSKSTLKLADRSSVLTSPNIKNIKQQQQNHVIIVSDSSSDDDSASEDEFHTAPSSPVENDSSYDEDVTDMDEVVNNFKER